MKILNFTNSKSYRIKCMCLKMFSFLFLGLVGKCVAQNDTSQSNKSFDKGIMIENLGLLIPWGVDVADLKKIGNPMFDTINRRHLNVRWDSVTIFGGLKGSINVHFKIGSRRDYTKFFDLFVFINSSDFEQAVSYCNANIYNGPKEIKKHGEVLADMWRTDKISVQIGKRMIYISHRLNGSQQRHL